MISAKTISIIIVTALTVTIGFYVVGSNNTTDETAQQNQTPAQTQSQTQSQTQPQAQVQANNSQTSAQATIDTNKLPSKAIPNTVADQVGELGDFVLGSNDAPLTIVEYASFTCGHCAKFHNNTFKEFKKEYIDTGKVKFIFREFPLDKFAFGMSMIGRCLDNDQFFLYVDTVFRTIDQWGRSNNPLNQIKELGKQFGLNDEKFNSCLQDSTVSDGIFNSKELATNKFEVNATPTFFIGNEKVSGFKTYPDFKKIVDQVLFGN